MKTLVLLLSFLSTGLTLEFNSYFGDGMMMQRDATNKIWGYGTVASEQVAASCVLKNGKKTFNQYILKQVKADVWEVEVEPMEANTICDFEVSGGELIIRNVLLGDVWICSGQSNMEQNMWNIENGTNEIQNLAVYGDRIRFTMVTNQILENSEDNFNQVMQIPWSSADQDLIGYMSAVCVLFGRTVFDKLNVPIGLVSSDWGGTPVEAWSNQETLDRCNVPPNINEDNPSNSNSYLWNGMINPIKRTSVKGFLWYQGENNGYFNRDLYNCTFPAMIDDWRQEFSEHSDTSPTAPFGFVQLASWRPDSQEAAFPVIRWHQTVDVGYVPNERMVNVFMASPLDTFDPDEGYPGNIHPRYKQIVAERLAIAGLNVAYGFEEYPQYGPFPTQLLLSQTKAPGDTVTVTYDKDLDYDYDAEISGFYFCSESPEKCDEGRLVEKWMEVPKSALRLFNSRTIVVDMSSFGTVSEGSLGYIWRESPVKKLYKLPIYSSDEYRLPSPPWKFPILTNL